MSSAEPHVPVLPGESLAYLEVAPGALIIDGTFGAGGHSRLLLAAGARVIAIDQDPGALPRAEQLAAAHERDRFRFLQGDFRQLPQLLEHADVGLVDGVLLDLGVSSMQLDERERGFAFRQDGPLDMRMSSSGPSAADLIADSDEAGLAALIYRYGEERHSRRLARAIVAARGAQAITTTGQLAEVIRQAYPGGHRREHPARRTFQALRIAVNDELGALEQVMADVPALLRPGGRLVVISYHSLEDRIVKHALLGDRRMEVLVKRPVTASEAEQEENPRSRSAKLRAATRRAL